MTTHSHSTHTHTHTHTLTLHTHTPQILAKETDVQPATDRRTGTATVTISVVNSNDNSPVFTYPEYTFNVLEEQSTMQINTTSPIVLSAVEVR